MSIFNPFTPLDASSVTPRSPLARINGNLPNLFNFSFTPSYNLRVDPINGNDSYTIDQVRNSIAANPTNESAQLVWQSVCRATWGVAPGSWDGLNGNASQAAQAGDTVLLEPGTETLNRGGQGSPSYGYPSYRCINQGTANNPIIIRARHRAAFLSDAQDSLRTKLYQTNGNGFLMGLLGDYVYWDGIYIEETASSLGQYDGYILLNGGTHRGGLVNCHIKGIDAAVTGTYTDNHGLFFTTSTSHNTEYLLLNNKWERHHVNTGRYHSNEMMLILYDQYNMMILHNDFSDCPAGAIFIKGSSPPLVHQVKNIAFNRFQQYVGRVNSAIQWYNYGYQNPYDDFLVYQNLFESSGPCHFARWGLDANLRGQGVTFVNNTYDFTDWDAGTYGGARALWYLRAVENQRIRNNLITNLPNGSGRAGAFIAENFGVDYFDLSDFQALSNFDVDRNLYVNNKSGSPFSLGGLDRNLAYWQDSGAGFDLNGQYNAATSGIYNNLAGGDFSLASGSIARTANGAPGQDILQRLGGSQTAGIDNGAFITGVNEVPGLQEGYDYSWHWKNESIPRDNG